MIDNLQQFVTTYSRLFPGEPVPPMPQKPEDLSMTVTMAMRDANPVLWQNMFGGRGAPLPADVQQRLLTGLVRSIQKMLALFVLHIWMRMQQMQIANVKQ